MKFKLLFIFFLFQGSLVVAQLSIGDKLPIITLQDKGSNMTSIHQTDNTYLLIDFWASWCAPCRLGNKKLVGLDKKYGKRKITIIGISIDTDNSKWLKAISKDKIEFMQFIDPFGFDSKTAIQFGVDALPAKYLFNTEGILIAINPSDEQISQYLN
ncbi:MAG TPA: TlpA disulfide reductase family protein [Saprospiraceae bacterium]|nr:TlpA disulfide reductase family protein [Saprospiraceae bacterium]